MDNEAIIFLTLQKVLNYMLFFVLNIQDNNDCARYSESLQREKKRRRQSEIIRLTSTFQEIHRLPDLSARNLVRTRSFSLPSLEFIQPFVLSRNAAQPLPTSFGNTLSLFSSLPSEIVEFIFNMFHLRELFLVEAVSRDWFWRVWRAQTLIDFSPLCNVLDNTLFPVLVSRLHRVRTLSLKNCSKLTGVALTTLTHLTLHSLNLSEETYSAYLDISSVSHFTTLTSLNLKRYFPMRNLTCLQSLTSLQRLVVAVVNGPELKEYVFPTTLRSLEIYNVNFDTQNDKERGFYDTNMILITNLVNLERLYLDCTYVSDDSLHLVSLFTNLRFLTLYDAEMAVVSLNLTFLTTLQKLEQFDCNCMLIKSKHLTPLGRLANLTKLRFLLGAPTLSSLCVFTALRDLTINCEYFCFTDGYGFLTSLRNLEKLELQFREVDLELDDFVVLNQLSSLTRLTFQGDFSITVDSDTLRQHTHLAELLVSALHNVTIDAKEMPAK
jgi:hypothetical protein